MKLKTMLICIQKPVKKIKVINRIKENNKSKNEKTVQLSTFIPVYQQVINKKGTKKG